jgi:hypothetical protein
MLLEIRNPSCTAQTEEWEDGGEGGLEYGAKKGIVKKASFERSTKLKLYIRKGCDQSGIQDE